MRDFEYTTLERLTSTRHRKIISENMSIGLQYPHEGIYPQGTSTANRREYPGDSSDDNRSYRDQRYSNEREDHQMKKGIPTETEDLQEEEDHKMMGDP